MTAAPAPPGRSSVPARVLRTATRVARDPRTVGLVQVAPRTVGYLARSWVRNGSTQAPVPISPGLAAQVALDELVISVMKDPRRFPRRDDYERAGRDMLAAHDLFAARGWLGDPASYHVTPPALEEPATARRRARGMRYEHVRWESDYEPHEGEPRRDWWLGHEANRTAHAWVMRHRGPERPWLVCVHGFGMGSPWLDLQGFRAARLYRGLGLNLAFPVLPLHGPRRCGPSSGDDFMSIDLIDSVHGLAQAVWDIRRLIGWLRANGAPAVGVYGLSLGGFTSALLASLEDDLACVIAGIPATDIPGLYRRHSPPRIRLRAERHRALGGEATAVHGVVSPLVLSPRVPRERRFVFAGLGDRMSTMGQAHKLWVHWERPQVAWYPGGHVGFFWSRQVQEFVEASLASSGLTLEVAA